MFGAPQKWSEGIFDGIYGYGFGQDCVNQEIIFPARSLYRRQRALVHPAYQHDIGLALPLAKFADDFDAVGSGHSQVQGNDVGLETIDQVYNRGTVSDASDLKTKVFRHSLNDLSNIHFIVGNQYSWFLPWLAHTTSEKTLELSID